MSYSIIHIGTLCEVELGGLTPQEWAKRELDRVGRGEILNTVKGEPDYVDTLNKYRPFNPDEDQRIDEKFIESEERLFEIVRNRRKEGGWFSQLRSNPDGTYDYAVEFINGQTSLTGMLCDMLGELPGKMSKQPEQTDIKPQEVTIEGWVCRNGYSGDIKDSILHLYLKGEPFPDNDRPERVGMDYLQMWKGANGLHLPSEIFPEVTWKSEPKKVKITITPIEE